MDVLCVGHAAWDISLFLDGVSGREQQVRDPHDARMRRRAGRQRGLPAGRVGASPAASPRPSATTLTAAA